MRSPTVRCVVAALALVTVLSVGTATPPPGTTAVLAQAPVDARPTPADTDTARDLMALLAISLEDYARDPSSASAGLSPVRALMNRLPPQARQRLVTAARKFSAQGEAGLRTFYGSQYAASLEARLRNVPALTRSLRDRRPRVLRPIPIADRPVFGLLPAVFAPQRRFSAPTEDHLRLVLQSIRVNSLNDDDTPDDEIYLGVWALPGPPMLTRIPGSDYWRVRRGEVRTLNVTLEDFGVVRPGNTYAVFVQAFEYDDGTWGEIWSAFIQVAQFAADEWLQAELGAVATVVVNEFLDQLWSWIADWFENADDFIDAEVLEYDFAKEPRFWAPGPDGRPQVSAGTLKIFSGANANYRFALQWTLSREPKVR